MSLYKVRINTERIAKANDKKEAILAVLKDLEIDVKFYQDLRGQVSVETQSEENKGK